MRGFWAYFLSGSDNENSDGSDPVEPRWGRIAAAVMVLVVATWLSATGVATGYFKFLRGIEEVAWVDTLLPTRWHNVSVAMGNHYVREAADALKKGDPIAALRLYRSGLAKSPANLSGRLALARLYVGAKRPDLARDLLLRDLPRFASDASYLRTALSFLLEFQFDSELQTAAEKLVTHASPAVREQGAIHAAAVAFHRGNFDATENILRSHHLDQSAEGTLLLARADFERGFADLALTRLAPLLNDSPGRGPALELVAQIHSQKGRASELARTATLSLANDPLSPAPRLQLLRQLHAEHRTDELARETERFMELFASDTNALLALGDFAANTANPALARRIQQTFARQKWNPDAPALLYAEACISAGRHAEGVVELDRYLQNNPSAGLRYGPAFDGLRTVALFGLNREDDAQLQLEHLLAQPNLRAENLSAVANRLLALGRPEAARLALTRAVKLDPLNQSALGILVRLEADQGQLDTLPAHLRQFLAMRRPSHEILSFVYRRLGSDLNLLHPEQPALLAQLRQHVGREITQSPAPTP